MNAWYVVYTQPQSERRALHHLGKQGYETYFPSYRKIRRHARREEEVEAPLFPRYLFVWLELNAHKWQAINHTRGVSRLIGLNREPTPLPEGTIEEIKARQDETGIIEMPLPELEKGR
ncbi:MAG: transcriptional activator RfaH, partial [SAR324 cluster bacterium]|nr:transcriptional activator RfaH [SAR324 cluster bacterium]